MKIPASGMSAPLLSPPTGSSINAPVRRGELAALTRAREWSDTPLGPVDQWPRSLRTTVHILLTSRYAMWMGWGPELTFLYNDAYGPTLGLKHPWALGTPAREVWAEIWRDIGPRIDTVLSTGEATYDEGLLLFLERSGFPEETYHTFSYSPLIDDDGQVNGMLCVVTEETERVISERRMTTLRNLAAGLASSTAEQDVLSTVAEELGGNARDLPFSLTYLFDEHGCARLACLTGIEASHPAAAAIIEVGSNHPWPAHAVFRQAAASSVLCNLAEFRESVALPAGAWDKAPHQAVAVPLRQQGHEAAAGFLIVGLNPYRRFDPAYAGFIELVAGQVAAGIANARAYEEERRRAEALAEIDRAKTAFFSNVSHEFRTPLTLMLGPVDDLLARADATIGGEGRELLKVVQRSGLRLQRLVNTLLDFSRIEAGRAQASYEPTDLASITAELASSFRSAMERAGLEYTIECDPLPQLAYVDHEMWEKVVLNLISNAFKYTLEGRVSVTLTARGEVAELSVADTGAGIPEHELHRLFERFYRVQGAHGRTHEGTGIGLALVHELVRLHGGNVTVASVLGRGSTFTVSIPFGTSHLPLEKINTGRTDRSTAINSGAFIEEALRWLPEDEGGSTGSAGAQYDGESSRNLRIQGASHGHSRSRILLADDNADMRDYIRRILGERYEVIAVANGQEALDKASSSSFDLVLTDVMMPVLDGFQLLAELRRGERTKTLPILLLSARAGEESRIEGLNAGADDYLVKPFMARELLARVEAHLSLARMRQEAERARRSSEVRLQLALEATGILAWEWDPVKDEITTSGDMARIFGKNFGRAEDGFSLVHPEDLPAHRARVEGVAREGGTYRSEFRVRRADSGATSWLEERGTAITGDRGKVISIVGVLADVTERKQAEALLRQQWHTFDTALSSTPDLLCNFDVNGRFTYANRSLLEVWQRPLDAIIGRNTFELNYPPDLAATLQRQVQEVIETSRTIRAYTPFAGPSGITRTYDYIFAPVFSDDGRVEAVTCSARDVTDRERMERELAASKDRLNQVFQQAPVAIVVFRGPEFVVELANPHYQAMLPGREIVGRRFADVIPDLPKDVWDVFHRVIETGQAYTANEWRVSFDADQDGVIEDHWFNIVYHPIKEVDRTTSGFIAVCTDVSAQVLARREVERVNKELEEFAYVASHDLQEPLRMVNIYTQLLLSRFVPDDPQAKEYAGFVKHGVVRMETLIRDLLTYSRTVQRDELPVGTADLSAALDEAMSVLRSRIDENRAVINTQPLPLVRGDTNHLAHVFQNLLSNALKYRKTWVPPEVRIGAVRDGDNWIISVRDNGIGFDQQYAERIFGLFKRLHKGEYPGTGLGLAICQRIVERYGGRMWAQSKVGEGAEFFFRIPAVEAQ